MSKRSKARQSGDTEDYEIGYRRPPRHTRFRPGQSGNPMGRPKGSKGPATLLDEALSAPITITESGVTRRIEQRKALFMSMVAKAIKGDTRAASLVVKLMEQFGLSKVDGEANKAIVIQISHTDRDL